MLWLERSAPNAVDVAERPNGSAKGADEVMSHGFIGRKTVMISGEYIGIDKIMITKSEKTMRM